MEPYSCDKARIIVQEMTELLVLELMSLEGVLHKTVDIDRVSWIEIPGDS